MAYIKIEGEAEHLKKILNKIKEFQLDVGLAISSDGVSDAELNGRVAIDGTVHL